MTPALHPSVPSPLSAAIGASALEKIDEETDRLFGGELNRQLLLHTPIRRNSRLLMDEGLAASQSFLGVFGSL
jgi:hypothetical protein